MPLLIFYLCGSVLMGLLYTLSNAHHPDPFYEHKPKTDEDWENWTALITISVLSWSMLLIAWICLVINYFKKQTNMELCTFGDAIAALKKGKIVRRQCWDGAKLDYVPETEDTMATIAVTLWNGKRVVGWNPIIDDLLAEDWIIE